MSEDRLNTRVFADVHVVFVSIYGILVLWPSHPRTFQQVSCVRCLTRAAFTQAAHISALYLPFVAMMVGARENKKTLQKKSTVELARFEKDSPMEIPRRIHWVSRESPMVSTQAWEWQTNNLAPKHPTSLEGWRF